MVSSAKRQRIYDSQEIAATMPVPEKELAKVVMVKADGKMVMWVLSVSDQVETKNLNKAPEGSSRLF